MTYPLRIDEYSLLPGTGGRGKHRGGLGMRADYRVLGDEPIVIRIGLEQTRPEFAPWPLDGGEPGASAGATVIDPVEGERAVHPQSSFVLSPGQVLSLRSGGGGGYGPSSERSAEADAHDRREGRVSDGPLQAGRPGA
jgi:N-methylhydantoinase B